MKTKRHLKMMAGMVGLIALWYVGTTLEDLLQGHELLSSRAFTYFDWALYAAIFAGMIRLHCWYARCPKCRARLNKTPMFCPECGLWKET